MNKVPTPTVKMAASFGLSSLSREPADSLEEVCSEMAGRLAVEEAGAGAIAVLQQRCRSVAALGLILDLTECFLLFLLVP